METKIFVSAYACEPGLGSEIGVGWHWVLELSKYYDLWVLTRKSNQHTIESWIVKNPEYSHINWLFFDLPNWARFWKKGLRGVRTYYNIWQILANDIVKRTMREQNIKIFLHVTYGNVLLNVSKYGQKQFFIWGPVGGLETISEEYSQHYGRKWKVIEAVRRATIKLLPFNRGFRNRCKNADLILCKTDITRHLIPTKYRDKAVLQTDVATEKIVVADAGKSVTHAGARLELITVGRLDAWRGFDLCIEALKLVKEAGHKIHLTIVGKGSDKARLMTLVETYHLQDEVTFAGQVSMDEYKAIMAKTDVVLNASLKEGAVTVSFDSMALGKPIICLDTTGYTRYFQEDYAVIIPIVDRTTVVRNIADAIVLLDAPDLRSVMGQRAKEAADKFTWDARGEQVHELIEKHIHDLL